MSFFAGADCPEKFSQQNFTGGRSPFQRGHWQLQDGKSSVKTQAATFRSKSAPFKYRRRRLKGTSSP
jgi:predicted component of type VI protein secretion system